MGSFMMYWGHNPQMLAKPQIFMPLLQARLPGGGILLSICPFVHKIVHIYFENEFDAKWHKWSPKEGHEMTNFGGQE